MTLADIREMLGALTDAELVTRLEEAVKDCREAAEADRDGAWHQACFAGAVAFSQEFLKRGIDLRTLH